MVWVNLKALQLRQEAREQRYEERLRQRDLVGSAADQDLLIRPPDHEREVVSDNQRDHQASGDGLADASGAAGRDEPLNS
jgi:hypothetical protein